MTLAVVLALPSGAGAQVLTQKDVSARMAWTMIEAATAHCEKEGYSITVAVVDRVGRLRAYLQGDKASLAKRRTKPAPKPASTGSPTSSSDVAFPGSCRGGCVSPEARRRNF